MAKCKGPCTNNVNDENIMDTFTFNIKDAMTTETINKCAEELGSHTRLTVEQIRVILKRYFV